MVKKEFIRLPLSELIPYANNPRFNDDAVDDVLESINQCGALDPIEVDENNVILSGHTRLKAMLRRGDKAADVIRYTGLSEEQKTKYRLLTNKTGEKATWDFSKMADEMNGVDFGGFDFGFDETFSIDDLEAVQPLDGNTRENEFFTVALTFPSDKKAKVMEWLKSNKERVVSDILRKAEK